jgi:NAD(P)-dependent dehydrogenase (short-subunit alcohol dehydrogenase family)
MTAPRTALVTGSTDGIGKATALALAKAGLRVVVHGRNKPKVEHAIAELRARPPTPSCSGCPSISARSPPCAAAPPSCASSSIASTSWSTTPASTPTSGCWWPTASRRPWRSTTSATYLLTELLTPLLVAAAPARVVIVSSVAHTRGRIHVGDLSLAASYTGYAAYAQSKLANVMHALELAETHAPTTVAAYALHPGVISTKLLRDGFAGMRGGSVGHGAATSIKLATAPTIAEPSGTYYNEGVPTPPAVAARDAAVRAELRRLTRGFAGLDD